MGTKTDVLIVGLPEDASKACWEEILLEVSRLENLLSKFKPDSELSIINKNAGIRPTIASNEIWNILVDCRKYHEITRGYFDVTLGNFANIQFDFNSKSILIQDAKTQLDLGAYGKGYALEKIKVILSKYGVLSALINLGNSSILGVGSHPHGNYWAIGIENPYDPNEILGVMNLKDNTMSTSGNSPKHPKHIVNPYTKQYIEEKKIVSIKMPNAIEAEVLSTTLMATPPHLGIEIMSQFVVDDYSIYKLETDSLVS